MTAHAHSSESVEHYTPSIIVDAARLALGGTIDLDPASCAIANTIVRATNYFTETAPGSRGELHPWPGTVFLNPPGGRIDQNWRRVPHGGTSSAKRWWAKLVTEWAEGRTKAAIFVGFSLEILQTTQNVDEAGALLPLDFPICYPRTRVAYLSERTGELKPGASPPGASFVAFLPFERERVKIAPVRPKKKDQAGLFGDAPGFTSVDRFVAAFKTIGKVVVPQ